MTVIHEVHQLISCQKASKKPILTHLPPSGVTFEDPAETEQEKCQNAKRSATKAELKHQIKVLQQKLNEAQGMVKDRDELEDGTLREELDAYQEQASQE